MLAVALWLFCSPAAASPRYVEVNSPAGFAVDLPTAPWHVSMNDSDGTLEAVMPKISSAAASGSLVVQALKPEKGMAARFLGTVCGGAPSTTRRARAGVFRVAEGVSALRVRCGVVETGGRVLAVTWTAPPGAYERGSTAFDKAVATLRPAD